MKETQISKSGRRTIAVDTLIKSIMASYSQLSNFITPIEHDQIS